MADYRRILSIAFPFEALTRDVLLIARAILGSFVSSFVGTIAPRAKRGLWVSIPQTFSAIASFIAPYLGGYLYTFSPTYAFLISVSAVPFLAVYAIVKLKD